MAAPPRRTTQTVYRRDVAQTFLDSLKAVGIDFAVLLPDTILYALDEMLLADPDIETMVCAREDEGIGIAFGACLGGKKPVVLMEGSGLGLSSLVLARGTVQRLPILLIAAHNSVYSERLPAHIATRMVTQPTLDMLRLPYHVLLQPDQIPWVLRALTETMEGQQTSAAILVPRHICIED
jgi:sulfopyruvate decarboxylase subunit alpha